MSSIERDEHRQLLASEVAAIREELAQLQERFYRVMQDVRELPGGEGVWSRVDAYPGTRLDRDMGAGSDADAWLAEVASFLEEASDEGTIECPLIRSHGHDPRGPDADERMDALLAARERDIARARAMRAKGHSLYAIHLALGRSKEWLRTYAGITD